MIDIQLDQKLNDIIFKDFDFVLIDDTNEIMQNLSIRLKFFLGEWFLNINEGLPYYQIIFSKNPNLIHIESILKNEILTTRGIVELVKFETIFDKLKRKLFVKFEAKSINGEALFKEMEIKV